jgi:hypothetical protein
MTHFSRGPARILLFSQRHCKDKDVVANAALYELEDLIRQIDDVDIVSGQAENFGGFEFDEILDAVSLRRLITHKLGRTAIGGRLRDLARRADLAGLAKKKVTGCGRARAAAQRYDLFFAVLSEPWEIKNIDCEENFPRCDFSLCYLIESWQRDIPHLEHLKRYYSRFDAIFSCHAHMCEDIERILGRPCTYLPPGIDAIRFSPLPTMPKRTIDVLNIGRRSAVTHAALVLQAQRRDFFYVYDTTRQLRFARHDEHRMLLAEKLKRTRYFFAYPARVDRPELHQGHLEIGYRFVEGAAAGAVMLGLRPPTAEARDLLAWQDAVIELPFDAADVVEVIERLDADPERLACIRRNGIVHGLRRLDWAHSWQKILAVAGLPPTEKLLQRLETLNRMAATAENLRPLERVGR